MQGRVVSKSSKFFETVCISEQLTKDAPSLPGGGVQCRGWTRLKEIQSGDEVVWTAAILEAWDELQQDSVDAVPKARLVPVGVERMFFTLVQNEGPDVIVVDRAAWEIKVSITQRLENPETAATTATSQQQRLGLLNHHTRQHYC